MISRVVFVGETIRKLGIVEHAYYRWRKKYVSMLIEHAERLKKPEKKTPIQRN
jgi:hypothetical protein